MKVEDQIYLENCILESMKKRGPGSVNLLFIEIDVQNQMPGITSVQIFRQLDEMQTAGKIQSDGVKLAYLLPEVIA